jgi:hypothetical protein
VEIDARRRSGVDYAVRAPRRVPGEDRAPVLCFLHGHDEGAPAPLQEGVTRHGPLPLEAPEGVERFLVIAPQLPRRGDLWARYADSVLHIVATEIVASGGDPGRVYLTGFSFGGNGALELAASQPGAWAAVWAVDPTRVPVGAIAAPLWLSLGEASRSASRLFVHRLGLHEAEGTPSTGDRLYDDRGLDHVGTARAAYGDTRVYSWLLARTRLEVRPL